MTENKFTYIVGWIWNPITRKIEYNQNEAFFKYIPENIQKGKEYLEAREYLENLFNKNIKKVEDRSILVIAYNLSEFANDTKSGNYNLRQVLNTDVYSTQLPQKSIKSKRYKEAVKKISEVCSYGIVQLALNVKEDMEGKDD